MTKTKGSAGPCLILFIMDNLCCLPQSSGGEAATCQGSSRAVGSGCPWIRLVRHHDRLPGTQMAAGHFSGTNALCRSAGTGATWRVSPTDTDGILAPHSHAPDTDWALTPHMLGYRPPAPEAVQPWPSGSTALRLQAMVTPTLAMVAFLGAGQLRRI